MEKFREIITDLTLSKEIQNYEEILEEGRKKRDSCAYFVDGVCTRFIIKEDSILLEWVNERHEGVPHPLLCYICPYYSIKKDDKRDVLDLFDIYLYYENERDRIERELLFIDRRYEETPFRLSLKRRREELIAYLEDLSEKLKIIKKVIKINRS